MRNWSKYILMFLKKCDSQFFLFLRRQSAPKQQGRQSVILRRKVLGQLEWEEKGGRFCSVQRTGDTVYLWEKGVKRRKLITAEAD
jgi:hypothetical protein